MQQYQDLLKRVLREGRRRKTSVQGVPTIGLLGHEMRFRPQESFPLLTVRSLKGSWKAIIEELRWFLSGSTNIYDLHKSNVHIWDQWATPEICARYGLPPGSLGPSYGKQWRNWDKYRPVSSKDKLTARITARLVSLILGREYKLTKHEYVDQVKNLIDEIMNNPDSKRMMLTSWNPGDIDDVFIAPCHGTPVKCFVADGIIDLVNIQRSADIPIGVPFNTASYSLLLLMLAQVTGLKAGEFIHFLLDAHVYEDQIPYLKEMIEREPKPLPTVKLNPDIKNLFNFTFQDIELVGYNPHPPIKGIPTGV